ncbi:DNA-directed RNA polymerase subunit beta [Calidifontibacillus erzurumensis]|uniref:DNA-directed RNA polymerase subunit beta n=1 Tax=Calidifontibacillus erzurumensis TaxID=2741433 RepID=A0A8J8GHT9_9BACI|nr:DNA-directed RNA polymerase subunit beta [Calidifontibacillus erzurumensis]NSL52048.1 DNA-directed RNA polymerase subunit beta [Calidifontibacillus erzurumensis]
MTNEFENVAQSKPRTRRERRLARESARAQRIEKQNTKKEAEEKPIKIRLIPIWLRFVIVAILLVLSLVAGLMVGYGVIGDGQAIDALKISTWKHLYDLVFEGTK